MKNVSPTPTPSKSSGLASLLEKTVSEPLAEKEISDSVKSQAELPKEEIAPPITPEPVKKVRWYQKIFNWLFK